MRTIEQTSDYIPSGTVYEIWDEVHCFGTVIGSSKGWQVFLNELLIDSKDYAFMETNHLSFNDAEKFVKEVLTLKGFV